MFWIEATAVIFGFICVWLTIRQNIWCWPTGLVQVFLYIFIFYHVKLYSDLILHVVYVVLQIYGWHYWLHGGHDRAAVPVALLSKIARTIWCLTVVAGTCGWGYGMATWTDAAVPYGDAFTTVASLAAQWLLARKKLESWILWVCVDVVAIGIYLYKGLYLTSGLYCAFLILAVQGFFAWRKACHNALGIA
ncbi:MAG: nicotinamide mononucleotide transporter [Candidatus Omnitrophica bacterium]|nr:nicotinamide mononucleotide transporter [Candidatus Omnitrophota bacterium]